MDNYNESSSVEGSELEEEYDNTFDGEERVQNFLKLTSNAGLTATIRDLGVLTPIHVMTVPEESEDDDYKYVLIDGLRRIFGALKNGQEEINAVVWDFEDKDKGSDLALYISLLLNRQ